MTEINQASWPELTEQEQGIPDDSWKESRGQKILNDNFVWNKIRRTQYACWVATMDDRWKTRKRFYVLSALALLYM